MAVTISGHASSSTSTAGSSIQVRRMNEFSAPGASAFSRQPVRHPCDEPAYPIRNRPAVASDG
jgi:hypothetical protein